MKVRLLNSLAHGKTVLVSLLLAVSLTLTSNPLTAQAATILVDDTPANNGSIACVGATFTTIQAAVNAAPAGSTITVCPGTYQEQVLINGASGLKLVAKGAVTVMPPLPVPASGPVFTVLSSTNITIKGFLINGAGRYGTTGSPLGIVYVNSSGKILNNVVTGMAHLPPDTTTNGIGILVAAGPSPTPTMPVKIMQNTVQNYQYAGIVAELNVLANVNKNRVVSSGAAGSSPIGIWMVAVTGGKVLNNTVSHDWSPFNFKTSTGISVQDSTGVKVLQNKVNDSSNGIELHATCGAAAATSGNVVKANRLRDGFNTIWLFADNTGGPCASAVTNNLIASNVLFDYNPPVVQYGIWLLQPPTVGQDVSGNHILNNKVFGFFGNGIVLSPTTLNLTNTLLGNKLDLPPIGGLDVTPSTGQHDYTAPYQPVPVVPWP